MIDKGTNDKNASQSDSDFERTIPTIAPSSPPTPAPPPKENSVAGSSSSNTESHASPESSSPNTASAPATSTGLSTSQGYKEDDVILGRYRVDGELGKGGMGVVYRCTDLVGDVRVAVKTIPPEISWNAEEIEEIRDNFRLVERLHHPHITDAKTIERDPANGQYFLVMELADGINLRQYRKKMGGSLPMEECINLGRQIASALDYGHSEMIIHRDIKPSNIMITDSGKVKVLDYGIASQYHESMSRVTNAKYETSGTGPYMAPEQWMGEFQDAKTDQYALAVLLYELYDGKPPFTNPDLQILGQAVRKEQPPKPEGMTSQTWAVFRKALSKKRKDRFKSCSEFIVALEEAQGGLESIMAKRRVRYGIVAAAAALVIMLALTALLNNTKKNNATQLHQQAIAAVEMRNWSEAARLLERSITLHEKQPDAQALLDRIRSRGRISLTSSPTTAEVWVDGRRLGTTPMIIDQLSEDPVIVELRADGYRPYRQSLTVRENRTEEHHATMLGTGQLRITSNPEGAEVFLNGRSVGQTPANISSLESGEYDVRIIHEGFRSQERTIQFATNQSRDLNFGALVPLHGTVTIETTPSGASVQLGSESGISPATFSQIPVGTHTVTVALHDHEKQIESITVEDGANLHKTWTLSRLEQTDAPPTADPTEPATTRDPKTAVDVPTRRATTPTLTEARQTDGLQPKARVVVAPASFDSVARARFIQEAETMFDIPAATIADNLGFTRHLTDALFHLHAFDMLEQNAVHTAMQKLDLDRANAVNQNQAVKMGEELQADFVVIPEIQSLSTTVERREIPIVNRMRTTLRGNFGIHVRVVDVQSSRIVSTWQRQVDLQERLDNDTTDHGAKGLQFINRLYEQAAREASREIVDAVHPLRIVAIDGRQITLNRGQGAVQEGDLFVVYKQGEPILDPDTQAPLGHAEQITGEIRVTQVLPRMSIAEAIGDSDSMNVRDICRPKITEEQ